jgi:hypothetical protein
MPAFMLGGAILGGLVSIVMFCAWPTFLLIWLRLRSPRTEIARWSTQGS